MQIFPSQSDPIYYIKKASVILNRVALYLLVCVSNVVYKNSTTLMERRLYLKKGTKDAKEANKRQIMCIVTIQLRGLASVCWVARPVDISGISRSLL